MVAELKNRKVQFVTLRLHEAIPPSVKVVITTAEEADTVAWEGEHTIIYDDPVSTVSRAIYAEKGYGPVEEMIIGIDPGRRPGIAVLTGDIVVAVHQVSVTEVEPLIRKIIRDYRPNSVLVRIGHGARLVTTQITNSLLQAGLRVEMVDESGTTPHIGRDVHTHTLRDIIAAINIARIKGVPVGKREVEPSKGEIRVIQEASRSMSSGRATIPRYLARQVARGEITIDEAIAMHKKNVGNGSENGNGER
ncbi:hypothetical protein [Methanocella arvoryzae]|uniref:Uncharacterized protein n=1 Tax=Methanocella arvoryzae (strain DSM 22066 / NBRC 105507 / MRE50) TaxID=351160 RepID=Q0W6A0_METAR|nr:hypothetical protein [Methanocella arvoryzae]CAJ36093.1 conserved hypothetical protein [Methanocella arvoryzae MRE50]